MALTLAQRIQLIVQNTVRGMKLADVSFGTVSKIAPLEVELEQTMLPLSAENLILTDSVKKRTEHIADDVKRETVEVQHDLKTGDKVVMMREAGGQRYVVLSKVV